MDLPIEMVRLTLQDLLGYFQCPEMGQDHEVIQEDIRALKNRQNLFQDEVIPAANEKLICILLHTAIIFELFTFLFCFIVLFTGYNLSGAGLHRSLA